MKGFKSKTAIEFKDIFSLSKNKRLKILNTRIKSKGGRNGYIISPRRKDYNRRIYRYIDLNRLLVPELKAIYLRSIYDPLRTGSLGLICYPIGIISYILSPMKLNIGDLITNIASGKIYYGDAAPLSNYPSGVLIYNINGKFIRSAGSSAILIRKDAEQALLKLKSGELRYFSQNLIASSGVVSNENHFLRHYKKAGIIRLLGRRPRTRPSSMNPVDHPMGGRTRGGCFPKNIKGIITLNRPTVKKHNISILYTKRQLKLLNN
jgi:large subunit ribosomal protein L2